MTIARKWTLRYLLASTLIFLVAGLLGAGLRNSLADFGRMSDEYYYAIMTVHGLGAFVGWAAFAVMGASIWVLAKLGFEPRKFGTAMFATSFWSMVVGVVLIIVSTLLMKFGGSWVALYPLPFHAAGVWSDTATFIFTLGVLLAGVAIITWCIGIWHTVIGPALTAERGGFLTKTGMALGFGYLWKRKFPTTKPLPFPIIPLTVIAIDMIIATVPLAVLLVEMLIQSYADVSVDPLLAKNILWWFGHPVVYLLLFPAVAVYYYLIPKYAKRPLVAGGVISVAWTVAVIANVMVWAHHVYLDYPDHTHQGLINTLMQPMTFALVIPSAISIYSLTFTILRSRFHWNAASLALFLGILSWVLAGLQGIVNATIKADIVVHNTMWIVGHFHHMALLNIGLVIFAVLYHMVPEMTGKKLFSNTLGNWHIWLTFWGQMFNSAYWMIDGLRGSPRRFSVPLEKYDTLNQLAVVSVAVLVIAQLLFVYNMWRTLRGDGGRVEEPENVVGGLINEQRSIGPNANTGLALGTVVLAILASGLILVVKSGSEPAVAQGGGGAAAADPGLTVFQSSGCSGCHTLAAAGASGSIANLDELKPTVEVATDAITNGLTDKGMPAFKDQLTEQQIADVAKFVAQNAGK